MAIVAKVVCILVASMVVIAPAAEVDIQCSGVTLNIIYCFNYLTGGRGLNSVCCKGIRALSSMAHQTPKDRQHACGCIKNFADFVPGLNNTYAAALPGKCGVSIPYPISPKTNCSKVH